MVKDNRKGWLLDLVVGSKVRVQNRQELLPEVYVVTQITPSGRITVSSDTGVPLLFDDRGIGYGFAYSYGDSFRCTLRPLDVDVHPGEAAF